MNIKLLLFVGILAATTYAQDGSPDLSFGENGVVVSDVGFQGNKYIYGTDEGPDGRLILNGNVYNYEDNSVNNFIIAYLEDGTIDTNFGDQGIFLSNGDDESYRGISILANNKILVLSQSDSENIIKRRLPNGDIDTGFANDGQLQFSFEEFFVLSNHVFDDGSFRIFALNADSTETVLILKQFLESGDLDTNFGTNGTLTINLGVRNNFSTSNLIEYQNNFYVKVRYSEDVIPKDFILKFSLNGVIDQAFGTNGFVEIPVETEFSTSFNVLNNGSFLVGCSYYDSDNDSFVRKTIKLLPTGIQDLSFGSNGEILGYAGSFLQPSQRFVLNGSYFDFEGGISLNFARFYEDGTVDPSFQFSSNYSELDGGGFMQLRSGKFLSISSDIWYNGEPFNIILQRFNNTLLGAEENNIAEFTVFPNPSTGIFTVESDKLEQENQPYKLTDISGKVVKTGTLSSESNTLNLSDFSTGIYMLQCGNSMLRLIKN